MWECLLNSGISYPGKLCYKSISHWFFPCINYAITVWGLASKRYLDKILRLQKRALRFIYSAERNDHAIPLFVATGVLPVKFLYFESVCCLMYDVRNKNAPSNTLNLFTDTSKIHTYNTRSSTSNKSYIKKSKLEIKEKAFSRIGAKLWNELPASLRELTGKKQLKKKASHYSNGNFAILRWLRWYYSNKHSSTKATILNNSIIISLFHMWLLHFSCFFPMVKLLLLRS